jgi:prevent-host-death family protein
MSTSHLATARSIAVLTARDPNQMLYNMKNTRISVATARRDFADVLARAAKRGSRIKVTRYGTTLAGIISRGDLARLEQCDDVLAPPRKAPARRPRKTRARRGK